MKRHPIGLSLVLPAYDEEDNLEPATLGAEAILRHIVDRHEIWIVDDGSRDGTAEAAARLAAELPTVKVLTHSENLGYGAALKSGFRAATLPYVAFTDTDRQFDLADLTRFLPLLPDNDFVVGYRMKRLDPLPRKIYSRGYALLIRLLFGVAARDLNCALKVMDRKKVLALGLRSDHYFINVEILVRGRIHGCRVAEVGVRHLPRAAGSSKVDLGQIPRTLREVAWLRRELRAAGESRP